MWTPELCPYCKSRDLELISTDELGSEVMRYMVCASCQEKFTNSFKYQGYYQGRDGFLLNTRPVKNASMPQYNRTQLEMMTESQIWEVQEEMYLWAEEHGVIRAASQIAVLWNQTPRDGEYSYHSAGCYWYADDTKVAFSKNYEDATKFFYLDTSERLAVLQDWWVELTFEFEAQALARDKELEEQKAEVRKRKLIDKLAL